MQEEERDDGGRACTRGVTHIKKTFRGDEQMMILQTYYRQNHYKPTYVLRSAVSLFLEIPFFIAAYRFLSGLELHQGRVLRADRRPRRRRRADRHRRRARSTSCPSS